MNLFLNSIGRVGTPVIMAVGLDVSAAPVFLGGLGSLSIDLARPPWECTIIEGIHIVPENAKTFNSIGRDKALRKRYDAALAAEREAMAN